ncbi:DNA (cytosine-5-)-methyltransferase [Chloroflexia bacterium SDU3-3]|nr:DNA (cytosine-5-)-methyltransferase [Chloroflexia bacterium SDU3-3]
MTTPVILQAHNPILSANSNDSLYRSDSHTNLTCLELFAGTGGLALGIHSSGFKPLALIELNEFAVQTLKKNSKSALGISPEHILEKDALSIDYSEFTNRIDLLSGGPPCQPFSTGGRKLGPNDHRNMFPTFIDVVAKTRPKAVLIENVKGLVRQCFREYLDYILKRLQFPSHTMKDNHTWYDHYKELCCLRESDFADEEQYIVTHQLIDTADFGVPQRRERVIISAFRKDLGIKPFTLTATHSKEALLYDQWVSKVYWERHNIQPSQDHLGIRERLLVSSHQANFLKEEGIQPWRTVRDALNNMPEPSPRGEEPSLLNHIQHPGARTYKSHIGSFWDYPSKALKAGTHGTPGGENMLRIDKDGSVRYFTTREAARLQTFPDTWEFCGPWGACIKQLGNAVPVEVGRLFALEIYNRLKLSLKSY